MEQDEAQPKKRGRPRAFQDSTVIAAAQALFWARGYDAVTLDDVTAACGVHKPSLYAAFGTKLGLFLATIDAYRADAELRRAAALASPALSDALTGWLNGEVAHYLPQARGCYLFTVAAAATAQRGVGLRIRREIKALDLSLHERFDQARRDGEGSGNVAASIDATMATLIALGVRARAGELGPTLYERVARMVATSLA